MLGILLAATVAAAQPSPTLAAPTLAAPPPAAHPLSCPAAGQQKTVATLQPGPKKLGDLPDAELYHAVWKTAGGCPIDEVWQNGRWVDRWSGRPELTSATAGRGGR